tara:strand:+ start:1850 stop:2803 length:954 start_codon:yes stop_codon:yes gene_type:complete
MAIDKELSAKFFNLGTSDNRTEIQNLWTMYSNADNNFESGTQEHTAATYGWNGEGDANNWMQSNNVDTNVIARPFYADYRKNKQNTMQSPMMDTPEPMIGPTEFTQEEPSYLRDADSVKNAELALNMANARGVQILDSFQNGEISSDVAGKLLNTNTQEIGLATEKLSNKIESTLVDLGNLRETVQNNVLQAMDSMPAQMSEPETIRIQSLNTVDGSGEFFIPKPEWWDKVAPEIQQGWIKDHERRSWMGFPVDSTGSPQVPEWWDQVDQEIKDAYLTDKQRIFERHYSSGYDAKKGRWRSNDPEYEKRVDEMDDYK